MRSPIEAVVQARSSQARSWAFCTRRVSIAIDPRWLAQSDGCDICDFGSGRVNALIELGGFVVLGGRGGRPTYWRGSEVVKIKGSELHYYITCV